MRHEYETTCQEMNLKCYKEYTVETHRILALQIQHPELSNTIPIEISRNSESFLNELDVAAKNALVVALKRELRDINYIFKTTVAGVETNTELRTSRDICLLLQNNTIVNVIEAEEVKKKSKKSETEKERSKFIKKMGKRDKKDKKSGKEIKKAKTECSICLDREADCVFIPCGHVSSCIQCGQNVKTCVICRTPIVNFNKVFIM